MARAPGPSSRTAPIGSPRWAPGEHALYYLSGGTELRKVKLTRSRGSAAAAPLTLLDGMQAGPSEVPGVMAPFTLTADARRLVYRKSLEYSNLWELTGDSSIADGAFTTRRLTTGTALRRGVALSPDRRWVAYLETSNEGTDLFRTALDGGRAQRLTRGGRVASRRPAWSPDGSRLAYGTRDGGVVRLAMLRVEGGGERVFGETSLPAMGDVAWGPSHRILHQVAGNRNFRLLDPVTVEQEWLVPPDAPGWSEDGRSVLAVDWDAGHLLGIGLDGRLESLGQLPFRDPDCAAVNASAPRRLVCVVPEQISDVWMVAGFDPEAGGD